VRCRCMPLALALLLYCLLVGGTHTCEVVVAMLLFVPAGFSIAAFGSHGHRHTLCWTQNARATASVLWARVSGPHHEPTTV
jgi:hypothetical protein